MVSPLIPKSKARFGIFLTYLKTHKTLIGVELYHPTGKTKLGEVFQGATRYLSFPSNSLGVKALQLCVDAWRKGNLLCLGYENNFKIGKNNQLIKKHKKSVTIEKQFIEKDLNDPKYLKKFIKLIQSKGHKILAKCNWYHKKPNILWIPGDDRPNVFVDVFPKKGYKICISTQPEINLEFTESIKFWEHFSRIVVAFSKGLLNLKLLRSKLFEIF